MSKAANNKRKGSEYERKIAKQLGEWLFGDKDIFWRSAGSGSTAKKNHQGDIIAIEPEGKVLTDKYVIECKNVKVASIIKFIENEKDEMRKWIKQVNREIKQSNTNKQFLIIFHKHGTSNDYMLLPYEWSLFNRFVEPKLLISIDIGNQYMLVKFNKYNVDLLIKGVD